MTTERSRSERGSVSPVFLAVAVVLSCGIAAAVVSGGGRLRDRARADAVADVTALGGAVDGRSRAEQVAAANGAELVGWRRSSDAVIATIDLRSVRGEAAATSSLEPVGSASRSGHSGSLGLGR
ncbi:MAG: hypothetical protein ACOYML_02760 [Microthrixaceae bacterium]